MGDLDGVLERPAGDPDHPSVPDGPGGVAAVLARIARQVVRADGIVIMRWLGGASRVLGIDGHVDSLPVSRPDDGLTRDRSGQWLATTSVSGDTTLVAVRTADEFGFDEIARLHQIGSLSKTAAGRSWASMVSLYEVAVKVLGAHDLDEALLAVHTAAVSLVRSDVVGALLSDPATRTLAMRGAVGHRTGGIARLVVDTNQGLAGKAFQSGRPELVDDYATDPGISGELLQLAEEEGIRSAVCVPMRTRGETYGVLCAWRRRPSVFQDDEVRVMVALADLAAAAAFRALVGDEPRLAEGIRAHSELEAHAAVAERALAIHEELMAIALDSSQPSAVLAALRRLTGGKALLVDEHLALVAADPVGSGESLIEDLDSRRDGFTSDIVKSRTLLTPSGTWLVAAPVRAAGTAFGYLCLAMATRPVPVDVISAEQSAISCALLLARGEAALVGERRLESEFIWDLLENRISDEAEAFARMGHANKVLDLPARVVLVEMGRLDDRARLEGWEGERLVRVRGAAARTVLERFEGIGRARPVSATRASLLAIIVPVDPDAAAIPARQLGTLALSGAGRASETVTGVGVSGLVTSVPGLSLGFRQAQLALTATGHAGTVAVFEELGVLQFLLAPTERADLEQFAGQILGTLVAYDRSKGSDLVRSLECYLDADCNIGRASSVLFVHYKTMRNRLQRIEELTGMQLDRQADRFNAQLALKILRLTSPRDADPEPPAAS